MNSRQRLYDTIKAAREGRSEWATIQGPSALPRGLYRVRLAAMKALANGEKSPSGLTIPYRKANYVLVNEDEWPFPYVGWCLGKVGGHVKLVELADSHDGKCFRIDYYDRNKKSLLAVVAEIYPRSAIVPCPGSGGTLRESPHGPGMGSKCSICGAWFYKPGGQMAPNHEAGIPRVIL